ncbi:MAG TPA: hypothetical protein VGG06_20285 [Thermoanaerobaculia bacterium]|jgi:hypothetical protein
MNEVSFPRPSRWTVKASRFLASERAPFKEGESLTIALEGPQRFRLETPARVFPGGEADGGQGRWRDGDDTYVLLPLDSAARILCGVYLVREDRGDTAVGVWTAEEDTDEDPPKEGPGWNGSGCD